MKHDTPAEAEANADSTEAVQPSANPSAAPAHERDTHGGAPHGFFAWLRKLGIQRQPGWIGGVASGVASRIGVDPIVVRGILVVLAIFAAPVVLFYGIAWLLLPDTEGRIHAQRLAQGDPQPALAGVAVFVLFGLFTPNPSLIHWNPFNWDPLSGFFFGWSDSAIANAFVNIFILIALTAFIVWLVQRNNKNSRGGGAESAWPTDAAGTTVASGTYGGGIRSGDTDAAAHHSASPVAGAAPAAGAVAAEGENSEPIAPGAGASTDELAAWKLQHEAWRIERERFNRAQADADRAARAQWAAENKARSQAFAAQTVEHRRLRKLERPRVSASAVFFTLGVALVAGAGSAIVALGQPAIVDYAATIGVLVAALVAALAMIIAGIARRRSGFLAFVTILLLVLGFGSAVLPRDGVFLFPGQTISSTSSQRAVTQPWGSLSVWVYESGNGGPNYGRTVTVNKANGDVHIWIDPGASLELNASLAPGQTLSVRRQNDEGDLLDFPVARPAVAGEYSLSLGTVPEGMSPDLSLDAKLAAGSIYIMQFTN